MIVYVVYLDFGPGEGYSAPIRVFYTSWDADAYCKANKYATWESFILDKGE